MAKPFPILAVVALLLLAVLPRAARAEPQPTGWLDLTAWQQAADGSLQPLGEVTVTLATPAGDQVAQAETNDDGTARLQAEPGAYVLNAYRDGYDGEAALRCGAADWDSSVQAQVADHHAIEENPLDLELGHGVCSQFLFQATPPPPQPAAPAPAAAPARPVHITIDDGYIGLCATVDLVNSLDIHATFFLTGQAILQNPGCVQRLVATGNQLGNHTYAHETLTRLSHDGIVTTLQRTENAAEAVAGVTTRPLCRPPGGATNAAVRQAAADWGCRLVMWDRDTRDWAGTPAATIEAVSLSVGCNGETILMHTQAIRQEQIALPVIVATLRARGCDFVLY
jgi:peptidoglycan/xylan/chitin deacetylase (PgdA/CDA1 family)